VGALGARAKRAGYTRWATFDCYGTLVDWESGIRAELERMFGDGNGALLLARYHELEPRVQEKDPSASYREVMATVLDRLAAEEGVELDDTDRDVLARSLPGWPVFPDVRAGLSAARDRGWKLVILSNTDRDLIEASMERIGVPFEFAIVASEIRSYKPARGHWEAFFERSSADRSRHVHVAQSVYHDIEPASELGIPTVWINRLAESRAAPAAVELPDLSRLAGALDRLLPGAQI
jgi:2-haloacid dehalogenase